MKSRLREDSVPAERSARRKNARADKRKAIAAKGLRGELAGKTDKRKVSETVAGTHAIPLSPPTPSGDLMPHMRIGRLETVAQWRRQVGKIYRDMRKGRIPKEDGTRLTYVANIGAQLAKYEQELAQVDELARQLEEIKSGRFLLPAPIEITPAGDDLQEPL
jgi:hypothetical protein